VVDVRNFEIEQLANAPGMRQECAKGGKSMSSPLIAQALTL
jgi:hypothetical protein